MMSNDCTNCGQPLGADDPFCASCGNPTKDAIKKATEVPSEFVNPANETILQLLSSNMNLVVAQAAEQAAERKQIANHARRLMRLLFTLSVFTLTVISILGSITGARDLWQISSLVILLGVILRLGVTFCYKANAEAARRHHRRIQTIERIGNDAAFAREAIQALRLTSDSSEGYLSPDAASSVEDDPFLKSTWKEAHHELQHLYAVLGPPPMKSLTRTRDG
jgi:cation transport ATPase